MKKSLSGFAISIENWLGIMAFSGMFIAIVLQVFYRYVLDAPLVWPFELSVYCYIYVVYIGAVTATRKESHVAFDMFYVLLSDRKRSIVAICVDIFVATMFILSIPSSLGYIKMVGSVPSSSLPVPWGVILVLFPAAMGIISIALFSRVFINASALIKGER